MDGGSGDDELLGGDGNDLFIGSAGSYDALDGGKGDDTITYAKMTGTIGVEIHMFAKGRGSAETPDGEDTLRSIGNFVGSKGRDLFILENARGGYVFGGGDADSLAAVGGVMRGDAGLDRLVGNSASGTEETFWLQRGQGSDDVSFYTAREDLFRLSADEFDLGAILNRNELVIQSSGHVATIGKPQLIYDQQEASLFYDADGTGGCNAELVATFFSSSVPNWLDFDIV